MNKNQSMDQSAQRKYWNIELVMDDESYFTKRRTNANGNDNIYSKNKDLAPASIKFKFKLKE